MPAWISTRADQAKERIRRMASRTFTRNVLGGIGSFGALFALDLKRWREPVLVSSTDSPGTKLKVAVAMPACIPPWAPTWSITASTTS
jgi:phosphoribosylaminoimidazole (AIR) synthetase